MNTSVHLREIRAYVRRIGREFSPRRIVLFGSHARGEGGPDADVDLLVVFAGSRPMADRSLEIRRRLAAPFPLDLLTRSEGEIQRRLRYGDFFLQEILEEGVVLYESDHPRVGAQGRAGEAGARRARRPDATEARGTGARRYRSKRHRGPTLQKKGTRAGRNRKRSRWPYATEGAGMARPGTTQSEHFGRWCGRHPRGPTRRGHAPSLVFARQR